MAFLNPERVERQGGQNQLYERSTEKGLSKEKLEEKTEGKIPHGFLGTGAMFQESSPGGPKSPESSPRGPSTLIDIPLSCNGANAAGRRVKTMP